MVAADTPLLEDNVLIGQTDEWRPKRTLADWL